MGKQRLSVTTSNGIEDSTTCEVWRLAFGMQAKPNLSPSAQHMLFEEAAHSPNGKDRSGGRNYHFELMYLTSRLEATELVRIRKTSTDFS